MDEPGTRWEESDSRGFLDFGRFFVPDREEQLAAFCTLLEHLAENRATAGGGAEPGRETLRVVELCCGEGALAQAMLARLPSVAVLGLDGSPAMLGAARAALSGFGERFEARAFDLADRSWRAFERPVDAFVSSLALHHLDAPGKRALFTDLFSALAPGGVLLIADLVLPATAAGAALAAGAWDEAVRRRAMELAGDLAPYEVFRRERWNFYADPSPDPMDRPSRLIDQLGWLAAAGFEGIDVFWLKAGHALFGGVRPAAGEGGGRRGGAGGEISS